MKVINLKENSKFINNTPEETIEVVKSDLDDVKEILVILFDGDTYTYHQGGDKLTTMGYERMLWHLEQMKAAILEGRIY